MSTIDKYLDWWTSIETDTRKALVLGARTDTEKLHDLLRTVYESAIEREASPLPAAHGVAKLIAQLAAMRASFHVNMLRAYPEKTHAEIAAEIDKVLATPAPTATKGDAK